MREVYQNTRTKEFSLDYDPTVSVCVGETDGMLEEWIAWHESGTQPGGWSVRDANGHSFIDFGN